jgi:hypothetical protein
VARYIGGICSGVPASTSSLQHSWQAQLPGTGRNPLLFSHGCVYVLPKTVMTVQHAHSLLACLLGPAMAGCARCKFGNHAALSSAGWCCPSERQPWAQSPHGPWPPPPPPPRWGRRVLAAGPQREPQPALTRHLVGGCRRTPALRCMSCWFCLQMVCGMVCAVALPVP